MKAIVVSSAKPTATCNYLIRALRKAGHQLLVISDCAAEGVDICGVSAPDVAALGAARGFVPELVLFIEGGSMRLFPRGLESVPCPTAWYGIDSHTNYRRHLTLARLFDLTFLAQKEYVARLEADGIRNVIWLPLAFPVELLPATPPARTTDLAFVGATDPAIYPGRARLLALLAAAAQSTSIGPAAPREMIERYASARMVFNQSANNDVNMRYVEAMGAGAVLLTDVAADNGVEDLFEPGRHLIQYRGETDLLRQFRELVDDPARIARIGAAAQELVLQRHTYGHRAAQLAEQMSSAGKAMRPRPADYVAAYAELNMPAEALRAAADEFAGMGQGTRLASLNRGLGGCLRASAALLDGIGRVAGKIRRA